MALNFKRAPQSWNPCQLPILPPHTILAASPAPRIPQPCQAQIFGLGANKGPRAARDTAPNSCISHRENVLWQWMLTFLCLLALYGSYRQTAQSFWRQSFWGFVVLELAELKALQLESKASEFRGSVPSPFLHSRSVSGFYAGQQENKDPVKKTGLIFTLSSLIHSSTKHLFTTPMN